MTDFTITDHGTVWTIRAVTGAAKIFAKEHFVVPGWAGVPEHFTTGHRAGLALCERLVEDGFTVRGG